MIHSSLRDDHVCACPKPWVETLSLAKFSLLALEVGADYEELQRGPAAPKDNPAVETHGYLRIVATRRKKVPSGRRNLRFAKAC
jgi:hypothetical protein